MAQKKETNKKEVKVRDLSPKKDAKGGARRPVAAAGRTNAPAGANRFAAGSGNQVS